MINIKLFVKIKRRTDMSEENTSKNESTGSADGLAYVGNNDFIIDCITVIGQIEGHYSSPAGQKSTKYEHLIPRIVTCEENDKIDGLLLILNTVGGDVEAGLAIAELIATMKKPTVSLVLGGGHSIGIPLAVSARRSFIVPSATMTCHPVRMNGLVIGVSQSFTYFSKMQSRIDDFICEHSSIDKEKLRALMFETDDIAADVGTIIDGRQAVSLGLIDSLGGLADALGALREMSNNS